MAARKNKIHHDQNTIERIRQSIQAGQIVKVLTEHVLNGGEIEATRITAGLGLLKKVVPDLAAVSHSGDAENPIKHEHDVTVRPQLSRDEWLKLHSGK